MDSNFYSGNRKRLNEILRNKTIVLSGYAKMQLSGDAASAFVQEANFWYLTGIEDPNWLLVMDGRLNKTWLIAPDVDDVHELFDGKLTHGEAKRISGADDVLDRKAGEVLLSSLAKDYSTVYTLGAPRYAKQVDFVLNPAPGRLHIKLERLFKNVKDCQNDLAKLRAIKQSEEIAAIKDAVSVSTKAFINAKAKIEAGSYEFEVEAEIIYHFRRCNADHAFAPIVASDKNACTLHYTANNRKIRSGELLLIDAGARKGYYSGDITRTYSVGRPTRRQREVHATVKNALYEITALLKPGVSTKSYMDAADAIMKSALLSLGLMKNARDTVAFRNHFPHAVSHGLGLDVHEGLGGYKEFLPGMVITVEPGIYIPEESIGVRIEEDVLITDGGRESLTASLSTDL